MARVRAVGSDSAVIYFFGGRRFAVLAGEATGARAVVCAHAVSCDRSVYNLDLPGDFSAIAGPADREFYFGRYADAKRAGVHVRISAVVDVTEMAGDCPGGDSLWV